MPKAMMGIHLHKGEHLALYLVLNNSEVLVLLAKGGFHETVLHEQHDSVLGGNLGTKKTL